MPGSVAALRDMRCMPTKSSLPPPAPRIGHSNIFKTSDSRHAGHVGSQRDSPPRHGTTKHLFPGKLISTAYLIQMLLYIWSEFYFSLYTFHN